MARPWYLLLICALAVVDAFVFVIPIDLFLITRILFKRDDWFRVALALTTASALGALILGGLVHWDLPLASQWVGIHSQHVSKEWEHAAQFVHKHGALGVGIVSFSFIPYQLAVVAAVLENVPLFNIFIAAWVGRGIKYFAYALLCAYAPDMLLRVKSIRNALERLRSK
jgi:membrane protein YqaA with SNARE-associated domain